MEQEDCDVITTLQTDGLAQLFGSEELESRTTPFQEGEDDEDMPTHHMMEHDEHSPCKTSEHKHYTPTRCSAKRKQEQVNLFQTKLEIEIFKDVILPKCCALIVLRYIEEEKDESDPEERTSASPRRHYKTDQCKEIFITFYSQKL
jgi:hypothetical protein